MALSPRTRAFALALCAWTLFTWTLRIPLLLGDAEVSAAGKAVALVPVLIFVVLGAVAAVAVARRLDSAPTAVVALAGWSMLYWPVRLAFVLTNDHALPFYVVHAVLGLVAIGLGALALRAATSDGAAPALRWR